MTLSADQPAPAGRTRTTRLSAVIAVLAITLGVGLAGFGAGWVARAHWGPLPPVQVDSRTVAMVPLPSARPDLQPAAVPLPDVRGLTKQDAQQALADAGVLPSRVVFRDRPSIGSSGYVVAQEPIAGSDDYQTVTVFLPVPAVTPKLDGLTEAAARQQLTALGSIVSIRREYSPKVAEGMVIRSVPNTGEPLTGESTLVIAAAPATRPLSDLRSEGNCSTGDLEMNGTTSTGLMCTAGETGTTEFWLVNRKVHQLTATAGIWDRSDPLDTARITITGDGKTLIQTTVKYGATVPIKVDLTGVLRLTITVTAAKTTRAEPRVGLADAQLVGSQEDLEGLGK